MAEDIHDPTNPEHVTRELMKAFPRNALYQRNKFTYVQYQQVIRRLIYATGNQFSTDVRELRIEPWKESSGGHPQVILMAIVTLTIPVLQSSRTQTGVQVATVGFGEDMWKGAVSDGLKKAAQQFGVAIDLAGADGEDTAPDLPAHQHPDAYEMPPRRGQPPARPAQVQSPQTPPATPQRGAQQPTAASVKSGDPVDHSGNQQWQAASRTLHATAARKVGQQSAHDLTHLLAERADVTSLKHLPVARLLAMNEYIRGEKFDADYQNGIEAELAEIALAKQQGAPA